MSLDALASAGATPPLFGAARGVGELGVAAGLPDAVVAAFGVLTHLGNPWLLLAVLSLAYLLADRLDASPPRLAVVLALGFGALALTMSLKYAFRLPRPPGAPADGYGFPSGHALGATVVYGGLAALFPSWSRRRTLAFVGVAALVAVSRVVIGVHYLVDIVAGAFVGVAFLTAVLRLVGSRERLSVADSARAFDAALAVAVAGLAINAALAGSLAVATDVLLGLGAAAGGWIGWRLAGDDVATLSLPGRRSRSTSSRCRSWSACFGSSRRRRRDPSSTSEGPPRSSLRWWRVRR
ncbi:phosphatase PAP2 family protein [Haloplanus sp. GCM10025708]|uniref:phosphatase PAP2 family protein n=1 Tax=Haloplanus sp. GCM10025708 TaxID=3252679 RepID=UPI0036149703